MEQNNEANFLKSKKIIEACKTEIKKVIVGQDTIIDEVLTALIAGGHVMLEGVPGLAKTLLVKTVAQILGQDFKRVQFTPDLLPADITGTLIYNQGTQNFEVRKGPVFTNILLADEINRAPPKVQSALLEAMAEHQVSLGTSSLELPTPFFVLATQNPIDQEGTYNLPEAELDRFLLKLIMNYPSIEQEQAIIMRNTQSEQINQVLNTETLSHLQTMAESVHCHEDVLRYIVTIVAVTRPNIETKTTSDILKYISFGASPRASIALYRCAKVQALFEGRSFVLPDDVKRIAPAVLRHRLILSYEATAQGITTDTLITKILSILTVP